MLMRRNVVDTVVDSTYRTHIGLAYINDVVVWTHVEIGHRLELVHSLARGSRVVVVHAITIGGGVGIGMGMATSDYALLREGRRWRWDRVGYRYHHVSAKNNTK